MTAQKRLYAILKNAGLAIYAVFALFPLLWMVLLTFKSDAEMLTTTFAFHPTLINYEEVLLKTDYFRYIKFAPEILVVLPLYMIYDKLGLYDTYLGLIWVYQLISMPLIIWVVRGYFEDISVEIEHAAQVDGYSWWQIFFKILVPLIRPGLVAAALLCFIFAWNSFTFPLLLAGIKIEPITVAATKYLAQNTVHYGQMAVAATFSALPSIIFAICIQKHLVRGLSFGAVKG